MTYEEATNIILNDEMYQDIKYWSDRHYKAQEVYFKHIGIDYITRKRCLHKIRKFQKAILKAGKR